MNLPPVKFQRPSMRNKVGELIHSDSSLPSFPHAVQKVSRMLRSPNVNLGDVGDVVKLDPSLTAKFLKLGNSAAYGGQEQITSLPMVMMRIGLRDIKMMISSVGVIDAGSHFSSKIDWQAFWLHSLLTARITERVMSAYVQTSGEEYLAGLLHRIGVLFIAHYFPEEFDSIISESKRTGKEMIELERKILDISHAEVGGLLCERWNIDVTIADSIKHYGRLQYMPASLSDYQKVLSIVVSLSSRVARLYVNNDIGESIVRVSSFEDLPEWRRLQKYEAASDMSLDLEAEAEIATSTLSALAT